jgi:hypothetical protein
MAADVDQQPIYPAETVPVIFADGIANFVNSSEFFKFYLFRHDPSISGFGPTESRAAAQVVLPMSGALLSIAFLNLVVNDLASKFPDIAQKWEEAQAMQAKAFKPI